MSFVRNESIAMPASHASHVLVVEDNRHIRQLMTVLLTRYGYQVSSVTRRSEADVLLAQQRFAVAVIDLCLPDGGGDEVARQLRAISPATRIVMTSAYAQTSPQLQAAATLGDAFIAKPFKNADLISAVAARPIPTAAGC